MVQKERESGKWDVFPSGRLRRMGRGKKKRERGKAGEGILLAK